MKWERIDEFLNDLLGVISNYFHDDALVFTGCHLDFRINFTLIDIKILVLFRFYVKINFC